MAPQIGFPGLAPRFRAHLCFTMVEGSNRRREEGDVGRGFRVPRATDWQGPIGFFVASPFPIWRRTHFPSTLNSCIRPPRVFRLSSNPLSLLPQRESGAHFDPYSRHSRRSGNPELFSPSNLFVSAGMFQLGRQPVYPAHLIWHNRLGT